MLDLPPLIAELEKFVPPLIAGLSCRATLLRSQPNIGTLTRPPSVVGSCLPARNHALSCFLICERRSYIFRAFFHIHLLTFQISLFQYGSSERKQTRR